MRAECRNDLRWGRRLKEIKLKYTRVLRNWRLLKIDGGRG